MRRHIRPRCADTPHGGPKGIRTPDLLAASQNGLNGVPRSVRARQPRAEEDLLFAEIIGPLSRIVADRPRSAEDDTMAHVKQPVPGPPVSEVPVPQTLEAPN